MLLFHIDKNSDGQDATTCKRVLVSEHYCQLYSMTLWSSDMVLNGSLKSENQLRRLHNLYGTEKRKTALNLVRRKRTFDVDNNRMVVILYTHIMQNHRAAAIFQYSKSE